MKHDYIYVLQLTGKHAYFIIRKLFPKLLHKHNSTKSTSIDSRHSFNISKLHFKHN